jgi:parallel beta-helix repeat protein
VIFIQFGKIRYSQLALLGILFFTVMSFTSTSGFAPDNSSNPPLHMTIGLHQYSPHTPLVITSNQQLANEAVSGDGSLANPYLLQGYEITSSSQHGISVQGTTSHFVIRNMFINTGNAPFYGIRISNVASGTARIEQNIIQNNGVGIVVLSSPASMVVNNTLQDNTEFGIATTDGSFSTIIKDNLITQSTGKAINVESKATSITNNTIYGNPSKANYGIAIHRDDAVVMRNTIFDFEFGIEISPVLNSYIALNYIDVCSVGIIGWVSESTITNNTLINGKFDGSGFILSAELTTGDSSNNLIAWNVISNFPGWGIDIIGIGANNIFQYNTLQGNNYLNPTQSQANDKGVNNTFVNNYWDEWVSPDTDQDGVVDNPYVIDGTAQNADLFPLVSLDSVSMIKQRQTITNTNSEADEQFLPGIDLPGKDTVYIPIVISLFLGMVLYGAKDMLLPQLGRSSSGRMRKLGKNTLTQMLGFSPPFLLAIIHSSEDPRIEYEEPIPEELIRFTHLLNPVRLSLIKLLYDNHGYPSYLAREELGTTWGKFTTHLNVLLKKELITAKEEFIQGSPKRVLYLSPKGRGQFLELRRVMQRMFDL